MLSKVDPLIRGAGRVAVETVPQLEGPLRRARGLYGHVYVTAAAARHNLRHPASIDPYELHWVAPEAIQYCTEPMSLERFRRVGLVEGGDWDCHGLEFRETDVFRGFEAHFEHGRPWSETEFYDRVLAEIRRGEAPWGCQTRADLEARCEQLDALYETIREDGYRTQRELLSDDVEDPTGGRRVATHSRLLNDEIAVDVARDGELLFADGRNRLAIAILLDLDRVPVMVLRRHERWQATRDELVRRQRRGERVPRTALEHPDVPVVDGAKVVADETDARQCVRGIGRIVPVAAGRDPDSSLEAETGDAEADRAESGDAETSDAATDGAQEDARSEEAEEAPASGAAANSSDGD